MCAAVGGGTKWGGNGGNGGKHSVPRSTEAKVIFRAGHWTPSWGFLIAQRPWGLGVLKGGGGAARPHKGHLGSEATPSRPSPFLYPPPPHTRALVPAPWCVSCCCSYSTPTHSSGDSYVPPAPIHPQPHPPAHTRLRNTAQQWWLSLNPRQLESNKSMSDANRRLSIRSECQRMPRVL